MTWRYSELQIGPIKNEHLEGESRSHLLFGCFRDCILSGKGDLPCFNAYRYCSYVRELRSELPNRRPSMVVHGHVVSAAPHGNRLFFSGHGEGPYGPLAAVGQRKKPPRKRILPYVANLAVLASIGFAGAMTYPKCRAPSESSLRLGVDGGLSWNQGPGGPHSRL